ncbi:MAG: DJ-1/PfpI family protein [Bacteroidales bacterium]|nr:DJ-1/PfpI family protein [Bacteroidales bacterium]
MKGIHIFLADGFEDMEAICTIDVLRRGSLDVKTVSISDSYMVTSSHGITVTADMTYAEIPSAKDETGPEDVMIFPGGMPGTRNLAAHSGLIDLMREHFAQGGIVAAICAAPGLVVSQLPGLEGRKFTCFDGFEGYLLDKGAQYLCQKAVADGNLVTGRGAGCAIEFGLEILRKLKGEEAVRQVRHGLMLD